MFYIHDRLHRVIVEDILGGLADQLWYRLEVAIFIGFSLSIGWLSQEEDKDVEQLIQGRELLFFLLKS